MPDTPMKPGQGVFAPEEQDYVWRRGEGPNAPPSPYLTHKNGIQVERVSNYGDAFDQGLALALAYETNGDLHTGAPHNVAGDRGGLTKYGIAQNFNPEVDVANLTLDEAIAHYREKYWPEAEKLPDSAPNLQALYFEGYMNMGRGATKSLQRAIGADPDGIFGPRSLKALNESLDRRGEAGVIREYLWQRAEHYRRIWRNNPSQEKFKDGWQNRVDDVGYFYDDVLRALA
jgi:hypothetical protein